MNEADTCRTLVRPKLEAARWDGDKHFYSEQTPFTDGRIIVPAGKPRRLKKKFSDLIVTYDDEVNIKVSQLECEQKLANQALDALFPQFWTGHSEGSYELWDSDS